MVNHLHNSPFHRLSMEDAQFEVDSNGGTFIEDCSYDITDEEMEQRNAEQQQKREKQLDEKRQQSKRKSDQTDDTAVVSKLLKRLADGSGNPSASSSSETIEIKRSDLQTIIDSLDRASRAARSAEAASRAVSASFASEAAILEAAVSHLQNQQSIRLLPSSRGFSA